jgi:prepilin-type N-terminal cleavage/methylation domain-containing protein
MINMRSRNNRGFSLVELTSAMVASAILVLGFGSVIVMSRQQLSDTNTRVGLGYDQVIIDRYVRTKLTSTVSDSMRIYADEAAEAANTPSSSGTILRAVDADSSTYHLRLANNTLEWITDDSVTHNPVDGRISDLLFTERIGNINKILNISMNLISDEDTLAVAWTLTLRN